MAYIILNTFKDFKIPKRVYELLSQHATQNHNTIKKEMADRLNKTLEPKYDYSGDKRLMNLAIKNNSNYEQKIFDLNIIKELRPIINTLKLHFSNADEINYEINLRLAYTLADPFYYIKK